MKLSIKKQTALYAAIHEPIMQARIKMRAKISLKMKGRKIDDVDDELFGLTEKIYKQVKKSLKIER